MQIDTDSNYLVVSTDRLDEVIKLERRRQFAREWAEWLADLDPDKKHLKRMPVIFKVEYKGSRCVQSAISWSQTRVEEDQCQGYGKSTQGIEVEAFRGGIGLK